MLIDGWNGRPEGKETDLEREKERKGDKEKLRTEGGESDTNCAKSNSKMLNNRLAQ